MNIAFTIAPVVFGVAIISQLACMFFTKPYRCFKGTRKQQFIANWMNEGRELFIVTIALCVLASTIIYMLLVTFNTGMNYGA